MDETTLIAGMGVALAALFWIVTQWNVIRTKNILLKFSEKSKSDANKLINDSFVKMEATLNEKIQQLSTSINNSVPDLTSLESMNDGLSELRESLERLPQTINEAVAGQLNLAIPIIQENIVASMDAKLKSVKAVEAHKLNAALRQFGAQVDESTGEIEGALAEQMSQGADPVQMALMKMLATPIPERLAEENPLMAQMFQLGKAQAVQMFNNSPTGKRVNTSNNNDRTGIFG